MQIFVRSLIDSAPLATVSIAQRATAEDLIRELLPNGRGEGFYVSFGGKLLGQGQELALLGVSDCSTVSLGLRLRGGGGDGGATGAESRDCYLKMYAEKKPDKVDPNEARLARWCRCALSAESLKPPCVVDGLGNVFNKEAVVHALLTKSLPKRFNHIRGLKDLTTVHLSSIPGVDAGDDHAETKYQCPVTGREFNGKFKFVALKGCGHVLSLSAFKEVQSTSCMVCYREIGEGEKLTLNGTEEEVTALREKMKAGRRLKEKNGKVSSEVVPSSTPPGVVVEDASKNISSKRKDSKDEAVVAAKKLKPINVPVPVNATKEIYQSIFISSGSRNKLKETYSCRSLPLGRN